MRDRHYDTYERPPVLKWIPLSVQHVFAMFGATILVPILTGLSTTAALFTAGTGTLLYVLITGGKVPAFLGSSFAFIAPLIAISTSAQYGVAYAMGGAFCSGLFYCLVAAIIRTVGSGWLNRVLPPVVIGSVIICIGLTLAPVAVNMASTRDGVYSLVHLSIAAVTLGSTIFANLVLRGFFSVIPVLIGLATGYLFTLFMGMAFPAYQLIVFEGVRSAAWLGLPTFAAPKFALVPVLTFIIVSLATICEHLGDTLVISKVVGRDFYKDPGLHRTLLGDGLATSWASLWGGPPNTTYGENIGVLAITRVYSVWVTAGAAVIAMLLSFVQKFGALIQTIPVPVMGGICMLLFGIIASAGLRTLVESGVDYNCKRNLTISSVILCVGIGGAVLEFSLREGLVFKLGSVALATVVGVVLNLVLPPSRKSV